MPLYANGEDYLQGKYTFWGGDTLSAKWTNIDDDLKPYTVIQLHPDDLPKEMALHVISMNICYVKL